MHIDYELLPYSIELRDAYLDLLPEQEAEVARGKLEWKFRDAPSGAGIIAVGRSDGRIIGLNGFMSAKMKIGTSEAVGFQSMDTIVAPAARGQGVFGRLIQAFYEKTEGALIYGFPNENSAPAFFGKLGWSHFGHVPMLVRPLKTGYLTRRLPFLPSLSLPVFAKGMPGAERVKRFGDGDTAVWEDFAAGVGCAVRRDADYLNWRIFDHPTEQYDVRRAADGSFAVGTVVRKHGTQIGYLMEALGKPSSLTRLIVESLREMRRAGAELAFAWCLPGSPNYRAYRSAGFYPFPPRLRPIGINFGARPLRSSDPVIHDAKSWYISYLDSDTA